ncbi:hypothetical protein BC751_0730 [Cecembia calidifontis]|uniref:Uncharacterized protein n=2 Tax=Cecembia calidifontis TaxID=1187080 RepID=A0A4Q7P5A5_9BACT|nr:hypothetical protein BC751_0730 [Cecembia calidifontis]
MDIFEKILFPRIANKSQMNKIIPVTIEYISSSRTIEILNLVSVEESKHVYVYNYEGKHFRVFESLVDLIQFFEIGKEPIASFETESDLKEYLDKLPIGDWKRPLNLKLNYLYRDGANYKQFGSVVFANSNFFTLRKASEKLRKKLISNEFFVPEDCGLPRLQYHPFDPEIDHDYHEFENFEWTVVEVTDSRKVEEFLEEVKRKDEV